MGRDAPYVLAILLLMVVFLVGVVSLLLQKAHRRRRRLLRETQRAACIRQASTAPDPPRSRLIPWSEFRIPRIRPDGDYGPLPLVAIVFSVLGAVAVLVILAGPPVASYFRAVFGPGEEPQSRADSPSSERKAAPVSPRTAIFLVFAAGPCLIGCGAGIIALSKNQEPWNCSAWAIGIGAAAALAGLLPLLGSGGP